MVPCRNAEEWQWHRAGPVITLGELFMALGQTYTAAAIYNFYRTCRLVVIKKRKDAQGKRGTPGSASVTGITGSALQATAIRTEYAKNKDLLVDEYVKVNNFSDDYVNSLTKERLLNDAIQFMHRLLLQDLHAGHTKAIRWVKFYFHLSPPPSPSPKTLSPPPSISWTSHVTSPSVVKCLLQNAQHAKGIRPPWLLQDFPQALPRGGVLSKCIRPSFLQWGAKETATLFGEQVHRRLTWLGSPSRCP